MCGRLEKGQSQAQSGKARSIRSSWNMVESDCANDPCYSGLFGGEKGGQKDEKSYIFYCMYSALDKNQTSQIIPKHIRFVHLNASLAQIYLFLYSIEQL